jgi:hypothetical protein
MSTIQELGGFLAREQAAAFTAPAPAPSTPTTSTAPAVQAPTVPAVEIPTTDAAFTTGDNGAPAARP